MAMGARSQAAKTYLERQLEEFPAAHVDTLIKHALLALQVLFFVSLYWQLPQVWCFIQKCRSVLDAVKADCCLFCSLALLSVPSLFLLWVAIRL
jgi:hypothetical protein